MVLLLFLFNFKKYYIKDIITNINNNKKWNINTIKYNNDKQSICNVFKNIYIICIIIIFIFT